VRYYIDTEFIERGHEHPIELISLALVREDGKSHYRELSDGWHRGHASEWVLHNVLPHLSHIYPVTRRELADELRHALAGDEKPEFWGYYADYDWVVFCQLFGAMVDLPKGFPMFCRDVIQEAKRLGLAGEMKRAVPQVGTAHNALDDALHIKAMHEWLMARADTGRDALA
jgi:hypothetical protein